MQTRKNRKRIKGGVTPKSNKTSKKVPSPSLSSIFLNYPLFESRMELPKKLTSLIEKFEDLKEPYNSLKPKIEKIKELSGNLHGPYGEINQPNNKKYIPEKIVEITNSFKEIHKNIKSIDDKEIEIKQQFEYITTYIDKKYGDETIFEKKTVVEGIIKNIDKIDKEIDNLNRDIINFHNDIDNLKIKIDKLNTDIQSAKKEAIQREKDEKKTTNPKNNEPKIYEQKKIKKIKSSEKPKRSKSRERSRERTREISRERSPMKSQEKSPEKIQNISSKFHLYNTNFITNPTGGLNHLNDTLNDISNKIFGVIGLFTKKYPHRIILKGGKAIQVLASTILPGGVDQKKYTYPTNDIDIIVIPSESGHTSEQITEEMIDFIKEKYPKIGSGENNQLVNGKAVKTMKIIYPFTLDEAELYNVNNAGGFKGTESLLDVTYSETETIDFYKDKTRHDCHDEMNEGQEICSQSIESMLYERLYYIDKYSNKQTELVATENLFLKKIKKSFLYLLFLYTYQMSRSTKNEDVRSFKYYSSKNADTIYEDVHYIINYSKDKPMYEVLSHLINNYPEKDNMTFNNVFDKVIRSNLESKENINNLSEDRQNELEKLKKIRDELINFNKKHKLNADIQPKFKNLIENYYDHDYLISNKAFVEVGIKDKKLKEEFNHIFDIYYEKE